jgi:hypothetical protein
MKKNLARIVPLCAFVFAAPVSAWAQMPGHPFGLGFQFGDPAFGFSGKYWLDRNDAIQGTLGWRGADYRAYGPAVTVDWQHRLTTFGPRTGVVHFSFDFGVGGGVGYVGGGLCYRDEFHVWHYCGDADAALIFRAPLTFSAYFPRPRLEAYAELAPAIVLVPGFGPSLMGGIGGRFYF